MTNDLLLPLELRCALLFLLGALVGGQVNWGIYRLAWNQRRISPWSSAPQGAGRRRLWDRIPILGWFWLRRESSLHGSGFWIRPLLIELCTGLGFAGLYGWQMQSGLLPAVAGLDPPGAAMLHAQYLSHIVLISLMLVATFIDFDEKTIPDAITVPGALVALALAALLPLSQLPIVVRPYPAATQASVQTLLLTPAGAWATWLDALGGLLLGLACYGFWCFALLPKTWTTRRGLAKALRYLAVSIARHPLTPVLLLLAVVGWAAIGGVWWLGGARWPSLLSALVGLAFGGGLIWAVRIVGGSALGREAMGFGDVTLMAMIGAFLGWQAALIVFFLAPFAALVISVTQWTLTGRKEIAFGPYLCLGALVLILGWPRIWHQWAADIFDLGWFVPVVVAVCLVLMGAMLLAWRLFQQWLFQRLEAAQAPSQHGKGRRGIKK